MNKKNALALAILLSAISINTQVQAADTTIPSGTVIKDKAYNVCVVNPGDKLTVENGVTFENIQTINGPAIFNKGTAKVDGGSFNKNKAKNLAGAIYTSGDLTIENSTFTNNYSERNTGGILIGVGATNTTIKNSTFEGNKAKDWIGVIEIGQGNTIIDSSIFRNNEAQNVAGGAIIAELNRNSSNITTITNSLFEGNKAPEWGAVGNLANGPTTTMTIKNTKFLNNEATLLNGDGAGALFIGSEGKTVLDNVVFEGNKSNGYGGAIATRAHNMGDNKAGQLDISNTTFKNNYAQNNGGAIYNSFHDSKAENGKISLNNVIFEGNASGKNGGAIYDAEADRGGKTGEIKLTDASFTNNSAAGKGGAIYANGDVNLEAKDSNVVFKDNKASDGADMYMAKADSNINMQIASGKSVVTASGVSGAAEGFNMNVNGAGTYDVQSEIKNATINVKDTSTLWLNQGSNLVGNNNKVNFADGTTLDTRNNQVDNFEEGLFTANGNLNVNADVNVNTGIGDNIGGALTDTTGSSTPTNVTIKEINSVASGATSNNVNIDLYKALGLNKETTQIATENIVVGDVMTPIRNLHGSISEDGVINYTPTGNSYNDFNSAIMASSVAAQLGGYLTQLNTYDEAFRNMDMYMLMTKSQRKAMKNANKYAASDSNLVFDPIMTPYNDKAGYLRPYANFESVRLKNGPKVSNVSYGTFGGVDSGIQELGNGWDGMLSIYAGYNGSHQAYQGNSIYQNGGTLGVTGYAYKDNFFTGLTANIGSNVGDIDTKYGSEDFTMLMTGIASKTGYNYEMADGKFIIQPSMLMSYSMINTFDYTNAAGVRMNNDPLHAIQLEPGIKFIGNLQNGWQPYAGVSVVWNLLDDTKVKANDVTLPELSIKPFVKYGVGVKKTWGERFTGFLQTFLTSGGRDGIGVQCGFRWRIGK